MMRRALTLLLFAALVAGCDLTEEQFRPQLVVEAILEADRGLPTIRLSRTAALGEPYDRTALTVRGAVVTVTRLDDGVSHPFSEATGEPGAYLPLDLEARVRPGARYRLDIRLPEALGLVPPGQAVTAETLVPGGFSITRPPPDSVLYNPFGPPPSLDVTPSVYPGRQAVYIFSITALEPLNYGLTPTYAALSNVERPEELVSGTSPLLNEQNYTRNPDGTLGLQIPWLGIAYYGPNRFVATALDDALYDFMRSRNVQFSPTTLSPGEIPDVLSNVRGGVGVFGSTARQEVDVFILEAPPISAPEPAFRP